jgi:hypothetical protein
LWVGHLQENGFTVEVIEVDNMAAHQEQKGVPGAYRSCHSAQVGDYMVEGHVPADLIKRFLEDDEGMVGLSVPGMVQGPPGMEGPEPVHYDVMVFDQDGNGKVYESR